MDEQTNTQALGTSEGEVASSKRKGASADSEPGIVRLKLPATLSLRVRETISELRSREVILSPEELMEWFLNSVPDGYWEEQILQRTPEEFYIRAAILIPELREKLARQARKALVKRPSPSQQDAPRTRKKRAERQTAPRVGVSEERKAEVST